MSSHSVMMADEEDLVKVWKQHGHTTQGVFYEEWVKNASAKHSSPDLFGADDLRRLYPSHSLVMCADFPPNILDTPGVVAEPLKDNPIFRNSSFFPLNPRVAPAPGKLFDWIQYGAFSVSWNDYKFIIYIVTWSEFIARRTQLFILHEGPEEPARRFVIAAGIWNEEVHNEIWVYNQSSWFKDGNLWLEIQKADWKDIILKDPFKKALQQDVSGFFSSEDIYKELAIPWKRGLIFHGPPGNGKTISVKAIMKYCDAHGYRPLYVKSFQSFKGEEGAMEDVFIKARQLAPCVLILEDLDSLINDRNRSFFLNQLDGLVGNDGLLVIGTTNHFERLDPGLSSRPSRFDRKFLFDDPDRADRVLYAQYWQRKLKPNTSISFPDSLVEEVADSTDRFSFAYLKEAFLSALVTLTRFEEPDTKPSFASLLKAQIKSLREQLGSQNVVLATTTKTAPNRDHIPLTELAARKGNRDIRKLLDALSDDTEPAEPSSPGQNPRDVRKLLDALSDSNEPIARLNRIFIGNTQDATADAGEGSDIRALFDDLSATAPRGGISTPSVPGGLSSGD